MKNNKESFDIYSVMKSKEISDYYRNNNIKLTPLEQECIIINSYNSLETQLSLLQQLIKTVKNKKDKNKINNMISLYEYIIKLYYEPEKIYNNGEHFVYAISYEEPFCNIDKDTDQYHYLKTFNYCQEYFNNINKTIEFMECEDKKNYSFNIDLLVSNNKELLYTIQFSCEKINNEYKPFRFYIDENGVENNLQETVDRYNHPEINRLELPFENICKVKFQTPNMDEPFYGILHSKQDGNGTWYRFLYKENDECKEIDESFSLDMSYLNLCLISQYAVFDWLERT